MKTFAPDDAPIVRADYLDVSFGQVHRLSSRPQIVGDEKTPLYCLHATAYSGRTFRPLMRSLPRLRVCALDAPGYGASTRPPQPWPMERYADALIEAVDVAGEQRIDLLGYHTGAFFALEMAARRPDLIRRLVLIGVPYFPAGAEREARRLALGAPMQLTESLNQFDERWRFFISDRAPGVSLERGFAHFVDELRAWPYGFWAHHAAFTYAPEATLARVLQPTLILNPHNHLAGPSRDAARLIRNALIHELPDLARQVLDLNAPELAGLIDAHLATGDHPSRGGVARGLQPHRDRRPSL